VVIALLAVEEDARTRAKLILNVGHRFVVGGQSHVTARRFARGVRDLHTHFAFVAGPIGFLVGLHGHVEEIAIRRNEQFARFAVDAAIADERGLHEEIRHVPGLDRNVDDHRTRRNIEEAPAQEDPVADVVAEDHARVVFRDIDQQVGGLADLVGPFISDDLQIVEAVNASIEFRAGNPEDRIALHLFLP